MGQKIAPMALRENLHYPVFGKNIVEIILIREILKNYFNKNGFLINDLSVTRTETLLSLNVELLFSRSSIIYTRYFRKYFKARRKQVKRLQSKNQTLKTFLLLLSKILKVNRVILRMKRLDLNLNKEIYNKIKQETLKYGILRQLKYKTIQDLLITSSLLLSKNNIKASAIAYIISKHFAWLPKKNHKNYLIFLRNFFKALFLVDKQFFNKIGGIKMLTKGRISGKAQASNFRCLAGTINAQTIIANIDFYKSTSYSKLGTFGWKLWIAKK